MKIYIKHMVSMRCKMMVKFLFDKLRIAYSAIDFGEVEVKQELSVEELFQLKKELASSGLELLDNKKEILIEKIKNVIIQFVHHDQGATLMRNSEYISEKMNYDYTYLANIFSDTTGTTIENFIIFHKIERVKELLIYNELSISEISYKLHYSSVAHLSYQFKKITGLTPSFFKKLKKNNRINLEDV